MTIWVPVFARYGQLTVLGIGETRVRLRKVRGTYAPITDAKWRVRCDCGTEKDVWPSNLKSGRTIDCGHFVRREPEKRKTRQRTSALTLERFLALPPNLTAKEQAEALGCSLSSIIRLRAAARKAQS